MSRLKNTEPHEIEAFGPVNTIMPYKNNDEAIEVAKMGKGSLVGSIVTSDDSFAKEMVSWRSFPSRQNVGLK